MAREEKLPVRTALHDLRKCLFAYAHVHNSPFGVIMPTMFSLYRVLYLEDVNNPSRRTVIDSDLFCGRLLPQSP